MKLTFLLSMFLLSSLANAESIKLMEFKSDRDIELYQTSFEVNKKLKRAWVNVVLTDSSFNELNYSDKRVQVPGLSYDAELNGVVYDNGHEVIVCGTFYNSRWSIDGGMSFRSTGRCEFSSGELNRKIDDGYHIRDVKMVEVYLNVE